MVFAAANGSKQQDPVHMVHQLAALRFDDGTILRQIGAVSNDAILNVFAGRKDDREGSPQFVGNGSHKVHLQLGESVGAIAGGGENEDADQQEEEHKKADGKVIPSDFFNIRLQR